VEVTLQQLILIQYHWNLLRGKIFKSHFGKASRQQAKKRVFVLQLSNSYNQKKLVYTQNISIRNTGNLAQLFSNSTEPSESTKTSSIR